MVTPYKRILILKPSALGDIVLALPVLSALHASFPEARISWLVCPEFAPLIKGHPYLDEIIPFDRQNLKKAWRSVAGWTALRRLWHQFRVKNFDATFDLQGLLRMGLISRFSGAEQRFGLANAREGAPCFYTHRVSPDACSMHLIDHYLKVVEAAGGHRPVTPSFVFPEDSEAQAEVVTLLESHRVRSGEYVVLVPGSARADKCWPVERYAMLADRIQQQVRLPVVISGSPGEIAVAKRLQSLARFDVINLAGQTNLRQLTSLLKGASLVVSNDTGPGHMAAGLGVPLVMLFSWSNPARIYPYGRTECMVAVEPFDRGLRIRSRDARHLVVNVTLEQVWEKVSQQLSL